MISFKLLSLPPYTVTSLICQRKSLSFRIFNLCPGMNHYFISTYNTIRVHYYLRVNQTNYVILWSVKMFYYVTVLLKRTQHESATIGDNSLHWCNNGTIPLCTAVDCTGNRTKANPFTSGGRKMIASIVLLKSFLYC